MNRIIIILVLLGLAWTVSGQNQIEFTYDEAGNRITRQIVVLAKSAIVTDEQLSYEARTGDRVIKLYPNPTKGMLNLNISEWDSEIKVAATIFDMSGRIILRNTINTPETSFNLSDQPAGSYLLRLLIDKNWMEWKIIKQ